MYSMTSVFTATVVLLFSSLLTVNVYAQTTYDCTRQCNELRPEIISHEICRKARKTLPRPKVGDFCTNGMEQGFSDACMSLCMNERPLNRISAACRQAAMEMPRPIGIGIRIGTGNWLRCAKMYYHINVSLEGMGIATYPSPLQWDEDAIAS